MRRPIHVFLTVTGLLLLWMVFQVRTLLELLIVDGHQDAILRSELPPVGADPQFAAAAAPAEAFTSAATVATIATTTPEKAGTNSGKRSRKGKSSSSASAASNGTALIPRIIHQTYRTAEIPAVWRAAQASCQALHPAPQWEYKLWTDAAALDFIAAHYPKHLHTFEAYPYPIQRADAIRYFILDHYGGIYLDLDDGCERSLEPLLQYPAVARKTKPTGISNDVLAAVPGHPFFARVVAELPRYQRSWLLPYITIMASTGPLFLSIIWRLYSDDGFNVGDGEDGGRLRILFPEEYNAAPWGFFSHHVGNSWHSWDVRVIFWVSFLSSSSSSSLIHAPDTDRRQNHRCPTTGASSRSSASPSASPSCSSAGTSTGNSCSRRRASSPGPAAAPSIPAFTACASC